MTSEKRASRYRSVETSQNSTYDPRRRGIHLELAGRLAETIDNFGNGLISFNVARCHNFQALHNLATWSYDAVVLNLRSGSVEATGVLDEIATKTIVAFSLSLLLATSFANELPAQTTTSGALTGVVTDTSHAVVPDAGLVSVQ